MRTKKYLLPVLLLLLPGPAAAESYLHLFDTVTGAQQHCPYDTIAWLKTADTMRRYKGQSKNADKEGYVCTHEAIGAGYGGLITHIQPLKKQ